MTFPGENSKNNRFWLWFAGFGLLFTGVTKASMHMLSSPEFIICGSGGISQSMALSLNASAHCWGCPVAIVGMMMLLIATAIMPSQNNEQGLDVGHPETGH